MKVILILFDSFNLSLIFILNSFTDYLRTNFDTSTSLLDFEMIYLCNLKNLISFELNLIDNSNRGCLLGYLDISLECYTVILAQILIANFSNLTLYLLLENYELS